MRVPSLAKDVGATPLNSYGRTVQRLKPVVSCCFRTMGGPMVANDPLNSERSKVLSQIPAKWRSWRNIAITLKPPSKRVMASLEKSRNSLQTED
jgi:hypothetical protein